MVNSTLYELCSNYAVLKTFLGNSLQRGTIPVPTRRLGIVRGCAPIYCLFVGSLTNISPLLSDESQQSVYKSGRLHPLPLPPKAGGKGPIGREASLLGNERMPAPCLSVLRQRPARAGPELRLVVLCCLQASQSHWIYRGVPEGSFPF